MSCSTDVYTLKECSFIGGSIQYFDFVINDDAGSPVNLNGATCLMKIRAWNDYGGTAIISKTGDITDAANGKFRATLLSTDTINLFGKFVYQPVVTDFSGNVFRPAQGIILISKAI